MGLGWLKFECAHWAWDLGLGNTVVRTVWLKKGKPKEVNQVAAAGAAWFKVHVSQKKQSPTRSAVTGHCMAQCTEACLLEFVHTVKVEVFELVRMTKLEVFEFDYAVKSEAFWNSSTW